MPSFYRIDLLNGGYHGENPLLSLVMIEESHLAPLLVSIQQNHVESCRLHPTISFNAEKIKYLHVLWLVLGPEVQLTRLDYRCRPRLHTKVGHHFYLPMVLAIRQLFKHLVLVIKLRFHPFSEEISNSCQFLEDSWSETELDLVVELSLNHNAWTTICHELLKHLRCAHLNLITLLQQEDTCGEVFENLGRPQHFTLAEDQILEFDSFLGRRRT